jgi:hypothetical protein
LAGILTSSRIHNISGIENRKNSCLVPEGESETVTIVHQGAVRCFGRVDRV